MKLERSLVVLLFSLWSWQSVKMFIDGKVVSVSSAATSDDAQLVSQSYALQRYVSACVGRGRYPIKFNGSILTVPYRGDPDFRLWGPRVLVAEYTSALCQHVQLG